MCWTAALVRSAGTRGNAAARAVRRILACDRLLPGHLGDARGRPLAVGRDDPLLRLERDADRRHEVAPGQTARLWIQREAGLGAIKPPYNYPEPPVISTFDAAPSRQNLGPGVACPLTRGADWNNQNSP